MKTQKRKHGEMMETQEKSCNQHYKLNSQTMLAQR